MPAGTPRATTIDPAEAATFDVFADDLIALADQLGLDRFVVGGISLGAGTALNLAIRYPERVSALVLCRPAWLDRPQAELQPGGVPRARRGPRRAAGRRCRGWPSHHQQAATYRHGRDYRRSAGRRGRACLGQLTRPRAAENSLLLRRLSRPPARPPSTAGVGRPSTSPPWSSGTATTPSTPTRSPRRTPDAIPGAELCTVPSKDADPAGFAAADPGCSSHVPARNPPDPMDSSAASSSTSTSGGPQIRPSICRRARRSGPPSSRAGHHALTRSVATPRTAGRGHRHVVAQIRHVGRRSTAARVRRWRQRARPRRAARRSHPLARRRCSDFDHVPLGSEAGRSARVGPCRCSTTPTPPRSPSGSSAPAAAPATSVTSPSAPASGAASIANGQLLVGHSGSHRRVRPDSGSPVPAGTTRDVSRRSVPDRHRPRPRGLRCAGSACRARCDGSAARRSSPRPRWPAAARAGDPLAQARSSPTPPRHPRARSSRTSSASSIPRRSPSAAGHPGRSASSGLRCASAVASASLAQDDDPGPRVCGNELHGDAGLHGAALALLDRPGSSRP